jgi:hypothetical protein
MRRIRAVRIAAVRGLGAGGHRGVEGLDVVADHGVERGRLRATALVAGSGRAERNCRMPLDERTGRAPCRTARPLYAQEIEHERVAKPWPAMANASPCSSRPRLAEEATTRSRSLSALRPVILPIADSHAPLDTAFMRKLVNELRKGFGQR